MHRENGTLADVNPSTKRGIGKMKATITQRFVTDGIQYDVECDCRFIFFCKKEATSTSSSPVWKTQYVKLFYEKDKVVPADGKTIPSYFTKQELSKYPEGYQFLAAAQATLGHKILSGLPTAEGSAFWEMYKAMDGWLQGQDVTDLLHIPKDYKPKFT